VLYDSGVFKRLYDEHEVTFEKDGLKVRVVGVPYHGTKYDMNRFSTIVRKDEDWLICVAHLLASKTGGTMFEGEDIVRYGDLMNYAPDVFCFGHWHKNQGITEITKGKWVVNIGSLSRGALTQDEMERKPAVALLMFEKNTISIIEEPLKIAPAKDVFDVAGRARLEARTASVDALVDNLKSAMLMKPTGSLMDEVRARGDLPSAVKERCLDYLEQAGHR
jgi:predicted phosphodiesterase